MNGNGTSTGTGKTMSLTIATGATIDVADNTFINGSSIGSIAGQTYTGVQDYIQSGRNGGNCHGTGIIPSKTDALGVTSKITLGVAIASLAGYGGTTTFGGQTVSASDTLVMYTWTGDANLSGQVDGDDFAKIDAGYSASATDWINGDFDFSGTIDADDYWLIDRTYATPRHTFLSRGAAGRRRSAGAGSRALAAAAHGDRIAASPAALDHECSLPRASTSVVLAQ